MSRYWTWLFGLFLALSYFLVYPFEVGFRIPELGCLCSSLPLSPPCRRHQHQQEQCFGACCMHTPRARAQQQHSRMWFSIFLKGTMPGRHWAAGSLELHDRLWASMHETW